MATGSIDGGFRAGLLQRLFQRADRDQSQSVGVDELAGLLPGDAPQARAQSILASQDADGNGQLTLAEFSAGNLAPETLASLLSVQDYAAADRDGRKADDRAVIDDFFAHADIDGDGQLSKDEFDAERTLRFAQSLDAGEAAPQHLFAVMPGAAEDQVFTRDEIMLGRRLIDVAKPIALDDPALDPKLVERLEALRPPQPEGEAPEAPRVDTATALGNTVRNAELTQTLIARLIRPLEAAVAASPTRDVTV